MNKTNPTEVQLRITQQVQVKRVIDKGPGILESLGRVTPKQNQKQIVLDMIRAGLIRIPGPWQEITYIEAKGSGA